MDDQLDLLDQITGETRGTAAQDRKRKANPVIEQAEEPMRVEAMGIRPADRLVLDRNDPQIAFHLHRDRELSDRLEKAEAFGTAHPVIERSRERDENQVTLRIRIGDCGPDISLGFHPEASLSIVR